MKIMIIIHIIIVNSYRKQINIYIYIYIRHRALRVRRAQVFCSFTLLQYLQVPLLPLLTSIKGPENLTRPRTHRPPPNHQDGPRCLQDASYSPFFWHLFFDAFFNRFFIDFASQLASQNLPKLIKNRSKIDAKRHSILDSIF